MPPIRDLPSTNPGAERVRPDPRRARSGGVAWAALLGVALGGFFDGILLHQILQWHHLLSLVDGVDTLRLQVLWDGYFHAAMYGLAAVALAGLWRAQTNATSPRPGGARLVAAVLAGFGTWHILDAVFSHWLLAIHRIRIDAAAPLAWDLGWLAVFGLAPLALAWLVARRGGGRPPGARALAAVSLCVLGAGWWAAQPPADLSGTTTVVFRPGVSQAEVWNAIAAADASLLWSDPAMGVVVLKTDGHPAWRFYTRGALLVSGATLSAGCIGWSAPAMSVRSPPLEFSTRAGGSDPVASRWG